MVYILKKGQKLDFMVILLQKAIEDKNKDIVNVFQSLFKVEGNEFYVGGTKFIFRDNSRRWEKSVSQEISKKCDKFYIKFNKSMVGYICVPDANIFGDYKSISYEKLKQIL